MPTAASIVPTIALLLGCGIGEAGMPLPRQQPGETYPGDRHELRGSLSVSAVGCFNIDIDGYEHFVIWPSDPDYHDKEERYALRLPGGQVLVGGWTRDRNRSVHSNAPAAAGARQFHGLCDPVLAPAR